MMRAAGHVLIALSTVVASDMSVSYAAPMGDGMFAASDAVDDGLMFSNDGAWIFLPNHFRRPDNSQRLIVGTDDCGILTSLKDARSMLAPSAYGEDWDDFDEDDPSIQGQLLIGRWLSAHPEIAVMAQGIDKWCGDGALLDEDSSAALATWRKGRSKPAAPVWSLATSSIA